MSNAEWSTVDGRELEAGSRSGTFTVLHIERC